MKTFTRQTATNTPAAASDQAARVLDPGGSPFMNVIIPSEASQYVVKYEAARKALAEAKSIDEVKKILDVSIAMKVYAEQAKNEDMEADAREIRLRAERELGRMMREQKETEGMAKGGAPYHDITRVSNTPVVAGHLPTLAEAGIDKNLAKRSRKADAIPDDKFEKAAKAARDPIKHKTKDVTPVSKEDEKQTSKLDVGQKSDAESETMDLQVEEATDKKADELVAAPEPEVLRLMSQLIEAVEFIGSLESKIRALEEELKTVKGVVDNSVVDKPLVEKTQELLEKQRDPPLRMKVIREFYPRA